MSCRSCLTGLLVLLVLLVASSCRTTVSSSSPVQSILPAQVSATSTLRRAPTPVAPEVQVVFRGGKAFARENGREWLIADVGRDELLWAPDGQRFVYLKQVEPKANLRGREGAPVRRKPAKAETPEEIYHLIVRNLRGDSVNEFPVYRPGRPSELDWVDNQRLAYLAPPDETGDVYLLHSVENGEILQIARGRRFVWSPGKKNLAYIAGTKRAQLVKVGGQIVWPREQESQDKRVRRSIIGDLAWSPDGAGLAFRENVGPKRNLVVLLVLDNKEGDLVWPLPDGAVAQENQLFWAESKVVIGQSALQPRFAASWKRVR